MASPVFSPGTPITSAWLNEVDQTVNQFDPRATYRPKGLGYFMKGLVVDVRAFGALGNWNGNEGEDDSQAIEDACAFAQQASNMMTHGSHSPSAGFPAVLYFPDGNYKVSRSFTITAPLHIQGAKSAEYSSGSRITQTNPNSDIFRIVPQGSGSSFSMDRMVLRGNGLAGSGTLVTVTHGAAYCNSQRYTNCVFGQPPSGLSLLGIGDDIHIDGCLFDVSMHGSAGAIQLGSNTKDDFATNVRITNNNFYACTSRCVLIYQVNNVLFAGNQVTQTLDPTKTAYVIDAINSAPAQVRGLNITGNSIRGGRTLLGVSASGVAEHIAFTNNVCYECGGGAGETLDAIQLAGVVSDVTISGNTIRGQWDTRQVYSDSLAQRVSNATITGNTIVNGGGVGRALECGKTSGRVATNTVSGYIVPSVSEVFGSGTVSPGTIAPGSAAEVSLSVAGALPGDDVRWRSAGGSWPLSDGVVVNGYVASPGSVRLRFSNPTSNAISQPALALLVEVSR